MKISRLLFMAFFCFGIADICHASKLYHWPNFVFRAYETADFSIRANGDVTTERAFYWCQLLSADGLFINPRSLFPLGGKEGNWEEIYTPTEYDLVLNKFTEFQNLFNAEGCVDNVMQISAQSPRGLTASFVPSQWQSWLNALQENLAQRADLVEASQINKILLDVEFLCRSSTEEANCQTIVLEKPDGMTVSSFDAWYYVGQVVIETLQSNYPGLVFGFYPGLMSLREQIEQTGNWPQAVVNNPTSLHNNIRYALLKGIYDAHVDAERLFFFVGDTYSIYDGTKELNPVTNEVAAKQWDIREEATRIFNTHNVFFEHSPSTPANINYLYGKWDLGNTQGGKVGTNFKQANLSAKVQRRNYEKLLCLDGTVEERCSYLMGIGLWGQRSAWDLDGSDSFSYMDTNGSPEDLFEAELNALTLKTKGCQRDFVSAGGPFDNCTYLPTDENLVGKLSLFETWKAGDELRAKAKVVKNFSDYVENSRLINQREGMSVPLDDLAQLGYGKKYQQGGIYRDYIMTYEGTVDNFATLIRPAALGIDVSGFCSTEDSSSRDFNGDGSADLAARADVDNNGIADFLYAINDGNGRFVKNWVLSPDIMGLEASTVLLEKFFSNSCTDLLQIVDDDDNGLLDLMVRWQLGSGSIDTGTGIISKDIAPIGAEIKAGNFGAGNDNLSDIAIIYDDNNNGLYEIFVRKNLGDGRVDTGTPIYTFDIINPESAWFLADFNGDQRLDLVQVSNENNQGLMDVSVRLNLGDGRFDMGTPRWTYDIVYSLGDMFFADITGDGLADFIQTWDDNDNGMKEVFVRPNLGDGIFDTGTARLTYDIAPDQAVVRFADMNGDAMEDLYYLTDDNDNGLMDIFVRPVINNGYFDTGTAKVTHDFQFSNFIID